MVPVIDLDKEYGIVLEGGGAKGAYQIGAWKALREAGVKIKGIAGTSVGALNGALMCMDDYELAEDLWKNISYSKVMDVDDDKMGQLFLKKLPLKSVLKEIYTMLGDGGTDITPLKQLIAKYVDEKKIRDSDKEFYILTFSVTDFKELDIDMKEAEDGLIADLLLASAYIFPLFKNEKLHGKNYIDGGVINNVPLESLIKRNYKDIIMIRIFGVGREKKVKIAEDTTVITIEPRVKLGNIMEFDSKKSVQNMTIGYYDALRTIYGLQGKIYYIEQTLEEWYYINQLVSLSAEVNAYLTEVYKLDKKPEMASRNIMEIILPAIAADLKLPKDWNYCQLYISMLEATAKYLRVQKYRLYTDQQLLETVRKRAEGMKTRENPPTFVCIILNAC